MTYFFSEAALAEHLEHVSYYEGQRPELGTRYLNAFEAVMTKVCENPDRFPVEAAHSIRRVRIPRFPFNVLYRVAGTEVEVLAIAHHKRRPAYWTGRR